MLGADRLTGGRNTIRVERHNIESVPEVPDGDADSHTPVVALVALPGAGGPTLAQALATAGVHVLWNGTEGSGGTRIASKSEKILEACQATWWAPPEYRPGWKDDPEVAALAHGYLGVVRETVRRDEGHRGTVWFDEGHPLLLDLWRQDDRLVDGAILVFGPPEDAVAELAGQGIKQAHAVALWEQAVQHAVASLDGCPVFVCSRDQLSDNGAAVAAALMSFLDTIGFAYRGAESTLASELAVRVSPGLCATVERDSRHEFLARLESLYGPHQDPHAVGDFELSDVSDELLGAHRSVYRIGVEARHAWLRVDRGERESARINAEMSHTMAGVNLMVEHLLNAV
jgi:hypothetical protein